MIDGCSRKIIWFQCSNNNKAETTHDLFLKSVQDHVNPLQFRCDMGSENRSLAKKTILLRDSTHTGCIGRTYVHNTKIEYEALIVNQINICDQLI